MKPPKAILTSTILLSDSSSSLRTGNPTNASAKQSSQLQFIDIYYADDFYHNIMCTGIFEWEPSISTHNSTLEGGLAISH